jgi:hypothetical protein
MTKPYTITVTYGQTAPDPFAFDINMGTAIYIFRSADRPRLAKKTYENNKAIIDEWKDLSDSANATFVKFLKA